MLVSSGLEEEKARGFRELGVMTFLAKPYTAERLLMTMTELLP